MLQQREVVGNVEDDTDEKLLKQVGNGIYAVLDEFNSMQLGVTRRCLGEVDSVMSEEDKEDD